MMSADQFAGKAEGIAGWRIPFLISIFLVGVSLYIRLRMKESPIFQHVKSSGMTSANPLVEAFTKWENLKIVLISLFGATAGQGVVWYTGQFYALFLSAVDFERQCALRQITSSPSRLLLGMPFFVVFGWRCRTESGANGLLWRLAARRRLLIFRSIKGMQSVAGSNVVTATSKADKVTGAIKLTPQTTDASGTLVNARKVLPTRLLANLISNATVWKLILLIFIQVFWVTMVYGPIAAYLVEAFPAKIRYTALVLAVSYRQRCVRRTSAVDRFIGDRFRREIFMPDFIIR